MRVIGPPAREAVPFLIQNLTNHLLSAGAPSEYDLALSFIGADSVLPLTQALSHPDKDLRSFAWIALSHSYTNLVLAVPELLRLANSPDAEIRANATHVLGVTALDSDDARALSALSERLNDESGTVRFEAARWLAHQGAKAKTALPALAKALNDKDTNVQAAVRRAIAEIDTNFAVEGTQVRQKTDQGEKDSLWLR